MKQWIPAKWRVQYQLMRRYIQDYRYKYHKRFARPYIKIMPFKYKLGLSQTIKNSYLAENKIENLKIASKRMATVLIAPQEILSFWKLVGAPTAQNGYRKGRNIINGKLVEDYGGGLCQLSGILYHLSLLAGLEILERHQHSVDIYTDETRYTPLGADATVVYGYKDLRIINNQAFPIRFSFEIRPTELTAYVWSRSFIMKQAIQFQKSIEGNFIKVVTVNPKGEELSLSTYKSGNA